MSEEIFLENVKLGVKVKFSDLMSIIDENYTYIASPFVNGGLANKKNENQGSAKLFSFAGIHKLSKAETLQCFGEHYKTVLDEPDGNSHQNIRNFMRYGWNGLKFDSIVLRRK